MTTYNVYLYREIELTFEGVEADTPEAAVRIARAGLTEDADDIGESGDDLSARVEIESAGGSECTLTIDFEPERLRKAAPAMLTACRMVVDRWERGDLAEAARACSAAIAEAEEGGPKAEGDPAKKPYSVLLLYPDDRNDGGNETYYAWVEAPDPVTAIAEAQRQALATNEWDDVDPTGFHPLLVINGHHYGQPMSDE
jgi:hypothetical protein